MIAVLDLEYPSKYCFQVRAFIACEIPVYFPENKKQNFCLLNTGKNAADG